MSVSPASMPCPRTDAVLALHLDGDLGGPLQPDESGYEFVCPQALTEHLRDCATCQRALRRARRLDAALAATAGRRTASRADGPAVENMLIRALSAAAASPAPESTGAERAAVAGRTALRITCAVVLLLPLVLWPLLLWPALQRVAAVRQAHQPRVTEPAAAERPPRNPAHAPAAIPTAARVALPVTAPLFVAGDAPRRVLRRSGMEAAAGTSPATPPLTTLADMQATPALRLLAGQHLLRWLETDAAALREFGPRLTMALAAAPSLPTASLGIAAADRDLADDDPAGGDPADSDPADDGPASEATRDLANELVLAAGRSERFVAWLRSTLLQIANTNTVPGPQEHAAVVVAARIGNRELDGAALRAVRRWAELAPVLAAALRACPVGQPGRAGLRLDAWQTLAVRGEQEDEIDCARLWFGGAPAATFGELPEELANARTAARRQRCLLAMGCCADGQTLQPLLQQLDSARLDDGLAAAYALAHLPHRDLAALVTRARTERDAWLLRAALTWAGLFGDTPGDRRRTQLTARGMPAAPTFARFITFAHEFRERLPASGG